MLLREGSLSSELPTLSFVKTRSSRVYLEIPTEFLEAAITAVTEELSLVGGKGAMGRQHAQ